MITKLGVDLTPGVDALQKYLTQLEPDPVRQVQLLECLTATFCLRMGNERESIQVANAIHKHITQIIDQFYE